MCSLCLPVFMVAKKAKSSTKSKKTTSKKLAKKSSKSKTKGKSSKNSDLSPDDIGIVVIEDDIKVDKKAELEARRLYLEEARSQEASD
jgi:hypothetical protein